MNIVERRNVTETQPAAPALSDLYQDLATAIAAILAHPKCPEKVGNHLGECMDNIMNDSHALSSHTLARLLLVPALEELTQREAA